MNKNLIPLVLVGESAANFWRCCLVFSPAVMYIYSYAANKFWIVTRIW